MGVALDATDVTEETGNVTAEVQGGWEDLTEGEDQSQEAGRSRAESSADPATEPAEPQRHPLLAGLPGIPPRVQQVLDQIDDLQSKQSKAQDSLNKAREQQERATGRLNDARKALDVAYRDLGQAIAQGNAAEEESTVTPTVQINPGDWANVPVAMLKLTPAIEKALIEQNEITTVGQVAEYLEANGTLEGLDGLTAKRAERLQKALTDFVEAQG